MSTAIEDHYEKLLRKTTVGCLASRSKKKWTSNLRCSATLGFGPTLSGLAVDLGSGPGWQSCALADLGAQRVLAVDSSRTLLDELADHAAGRPVEPVHADIREFDRLVAPNSAKAIVCMGDTLPHLPDGDAVRALLAHAFTALQDGGLLVLTFRDLSHALEGLDRIVPIRATDDRIMTCILDFGPERVTVTDVIHRRENGAWHMEKSSYDKLRLSPSSVAENLIDLGFEVVQNAPAGRMQAMVARKPGPGAS